MSKNNNQPISFTVFTEQWFPYHACAGRGTVFYTVMTRGTKEYKGKAQFWFVCRTWPETYSATQHWLRLGYNVAGCSSGLGWHFVVVPPQGSKPQVVYCFDVSNPIFDICIIQRKKESFHYTILYVTRDCYSREIIVVMTDDKTVRFSVLWPVLVSHQMLF